MPTDRARWNERYADVLPPRPAAPEVIRTWPDVEELLPHRGRAVDVACGTGAQTLWLAERGLEVVAIDVADRAIDVLCAAADDTDHAVRITARVVDLEGGLPVDASTVDVLLCQRFRQPNLYEAFVQVLRPHGIGMVTVLSAVGLDRAPGPFHAPADELRTAFTRADTEVLHSREGGGLASVVFRRR